MMYFDALNIILKKVHYIFILYICVHIFIHLSLLNIYKVFNASLK